MASQQTIAPKADQPRATTDSLKRTEAPANLQYKVTGIKSYKESTQKMMEAYGGL